jgi:hypothetical protein
MLRGKEALGYLGLMCQMAALLAMARECPYEPTQEAAPFDCCGTRVRGARPWRLRSALRMVSISVAQAFNRPAHASGVVV